MICLVCYSAVCLISALPPWLCAALLPHCPGGRPLLSALLWMHLASSPLPFSLSRTLLPVLPKFIVPNTPLVLCHPCLASRTKAMLGSIAQEVLCNLTPPTPRTPPPPPAQFFPCFSLLQENSPGALGDSRPGPIVLYPVPAPRLPLCPHLGSPSHLSTCHAFAPPPCSSSQATSQQLSKL